MQTNFSNRICTKKKGRRKHCLQQKSDINDTFNGLNARITALANTASLAMDDTMGDVGLSGGRGGYREYVFCVVLGS